MPGIRKWFSVRGCDSDDDKVFRFPESGVIFLDTTAATRVLALS